MKVIMVQGTMSGVGKSLVAAGLCRIFRQDGYRVCPFKSQNMALNSFITEDGLEMGRAQVVQAEAAGIKPDARMNPILLKPNSDTGSQVIVCGKVQGNMDAKEYYRRKQQFLPAVKEAYQSLANEYEIIVIEGAGSPAEINLKEHDFVNMGMAGIADSPVILVGDIDRGGVFAQLYGTIALLEENEKLRIKGMLINKFRGDAGILEPGLVMLEEMTGKPVLGVIPYLQIDLDEEDSLSEKLYVPAGKKAASVGSPLKIVVIHLPRMSNYTDFSVLEQSELVSVCYARQPSDLKNPDMVIIPGSKSVLSDMRWLRESGMEALLRKIASRGIPVLGICGGYQMLGVRISDTSGAEGGGTIEGVGLLPVETRLLAGKYKSQARGYFGNAEGVFSELSGMEFAGYELHHGETVQIDRKEIGYRQADGGDGAGVFTRTESGEVNGVCLGNVYGTYVHGIFDADGVAQKLLRALLQDKGFEPDCLRVESRAEYKESQYNLLAGRLRESLSVDKIYEILERS